MAIFVVPSSSGVVTTVSCGEVVGIPSSDVVRVGFVVVRGGNVVGMR